MGTTVTRTRPGGGPQLMGAPAAHQVRGLEWDLDTNPITNAHSSPENGDDAIKTDIK